MNTDERRARKEILQERLVRVEDLPKFEFHWANFLKKGHKAQTPKAIIEEFTKYLDSIYCKGVVSYYGERNV